MKPRMLVIEDSPTARAALCAYFEAASFEVVSAGDAAVAMQVIAREEFAVVLTDLRLGDSRNLDGLAVIRAGRSRFPGAAVLLLSAYVTPTVRAAAIEAGADAVLDKTLSLRAIASQVSDLLGRRA